MQEIKYGIAGTALLGLAGCFLPLGPPIHLWVLRMIDPTAVYLTLVGLVVALASMVIAIARPPLRRVHAVAALLGFASAVLALRDALADFVVHGGVGARLVGIAPVAGILLSLIAIATLRRPATS